MRAIVCGAGIAGLAAAASLQRGGWDVVVLEQAPALRDGGYMIDFFGPGFDAAERIGLLPDLRRRAYDVDMVQWCDAAGRPKARLHYGRMRDAAGGKLLSLLRGDLERALAASLPDAVDVRLGMTVTDVRTHDGGVTVTVGDGVLDADLLVGADGVHSRVRASVFGPEREFLRPLGLRTAAWFVDEPDAARALGDRFVIQSAPGRMAGVYAVGETRVATFLVFADDSPAHGDDPLPGIRRRYGDMGGLVADVLRADPLGEVYEDVVAQVEVPSWRRGRVILIGDAAYAVSLVAGQGASLALAGGIALGETLDLAALADAGWDVPDALEDFERRVRPAVEEKQAGGRRTARWFLPMTPARLRLRNLSMRIADLPVLNRLLAPLLALDTKGFAPAARPGGH